MLENLEAALKQKESHPKKTLSTHIEECESNLKEFLRFCGLQKYEDFGKNLCYYHDLGKLREDFSPNKDQNPPHSPYSVFLMFKAIERDTDLNLLGPWFVLKHHGTLTTPADINEEKIANYIPKASENEKELFKEKIVEYKEKLVRFLMQPESKEEIINLCDVFGLFKLADLFSSYDIDEKLRSVEKSIIDFESRIKGKIRERGLKVEEERLKTQVELSKSPGHLLLRAPTGWGKTAASLFYALGKSSKIIYVLPTITSIKKFHDDLCHHFKKENVGELFYYTDVEILREKRDIRELMLSSYFVKPIMVSTLDQLLLTFLQLGKYFFKRPQMRGATLILDEVHTFTPNMLHILFFFLDQYLKRYKLNLCVMSATFPSKLRKKFENLLGRPQVIWLNEEFKRRRRIEFLRKDQDVSELIEEIASLYNRKRNDCFKILVVCNTVKKGQRVFELLSERIPHDELKLLHARFIYKHRNEKEDEIYKLIKGNHSFVLVATQVVEVSLDVSFDFMVTECSPLESLVQRLGRVNRYAEKVKSVNVWITYPTELENRKKCPYYPGDVEDVWKFLERFELGKLKNELQLIEEYDKEVYLPQADRNIQTLFRKWDEHTHFAYSWKTGEEEVQKLLKFREDINRLVIPDVYEDEVKELYQQLEGADWSKKKEIFAEIKNYTVSVPIWKARLSAERSEGFSFPIVRVDYDKKLGIKDDFEPAII